ncbi:MAG: permease [Candidatus Aminicenantes bacterium]|nr:permease [Candidatus Aminicenantes bacterium]
MNNQLLNIIDSIVSDFVGLWPYLALTIPLSVAIQVTGAAKYIDRALGSRPKTAILLAVLVGAFSPFCSCSVIPVVASLLISGVPLGPVMAFWIASPSMDPEIFFLSAAALGWPLAVWRLTSTLVLSLAAGFITQFLMQKGWLGMNILRNQGIPAPKITFQAIRSALQTRPLVPAAAASQAASPSAGGGVAMGAVHMSNSRGSLPVPGACAGSCSCGCAASPVSFSRKLVKETWAAVSMVMKFMVLSFILKALITLYVPMEWLTGLLGKQNAFSIFNAALIGVPMYTSNLAALPLVKVLIGQGMSPAAALAFLIAGPTTTLPAMAAVWGITNRRVFVLYLSFSFLGALVFGYLYLIVS